MPPIFFDPSPFFSFLNMTSSSSTSSPGTGAATQTTEMDMLGQFLRRSMGLQSISQSRLTKFRGLPQQQGELSLSEWLEGFEEVTAQQRLGDSEKARLLLDHLAGPAWEEAMCLPEEKRRKYVEVVGTLKLCFGFQETTQSLSSQFHNRVQREGESLCDFSRALLRTYTKMEKAAETEAQSQALGQLRDQALADQFVNGARDAWVRRELRRIQLDQKTGGFGVVRQEALRLFQESPTQNQNQRSRAREVEVEIARLTPSLAPCESTLKEVVEQQQTIIEELTKLKNDVALLKTQRTQRRRPLEEVECYQCGQMGHYKRNCPKLGGTSSPQPSGN